MSEAKEEPAETEEEKKEEMVNIPLDSEERDPKELEEQKSDDEFLSPGWEATWKLGLNLPNVKQAIKYTDDKARAFLQLNPSADNHIDADRFVEYLAKSSLKGLLPNLVKILVTTYNGH